MNQQDAIQLIASAKLFLKNNQAQWADLGCGSGTFTQALAHLLPPQSSIYAIDQSLQSIASTELVNIHFQRTNFENDPLDLPPLDGFMLANALHYVKDKKNFLIDLQQYFQEKGQFIIVEYDTVIANPWVPYPIDFQTSTSLFKEIGYENMVKLGERPSIYGQANMYAIGVF